MTSSCPSCIANSVTNFSLLQSAIGIGLNPKCPSCGTRWSVGPNWQGNFTGFLLLAFVFAVSFSIKEQSFLPYLALPVALITGAAVVCRYAKPILIKPMPRWHSLLHYVVLVLFLIALIHFFGS